MLVDRKEEGKTMRRIEENTTLVGISELRTRAEAILKVAQHEPVIVEKRHKPMAVLVPITEYRRTQETLERLEEYLLGLLAKERERRSKPTSYLTLEELEKRVGLHRS